MTAADTKIEKEVSKTVSFEMLKTELFFPWRTFDVTSVLVEMTNENLIVLLTAVNPKLEQFCEDYIAR